MSGYRAETMANITTTRPIQIIEKIDELVHDGKASSRSSVIREAIKNYLTSTE